MRQFVRTGWVASIVVGLATASGAQQTPPPGQPAQGKTAQGKTATKTAIPPRPAILDQVLATVNNQKITRDELIRFLYQTGAPAGATLDDENAIYQMSMEQLVNNALIKQFIQKQTSLVIPDKQVDDEFADFEKKIKQAGEDVNVVLASYGVTVAQVRDEMRDKLRWLKYMDAVATDANLKKFVEENKDVFNRTQVQASHILVRVEPTAPAADKEKAKAKIVAIKKEIDSQKIAFADAANKYSEDDGNKSSPRGGDLGYFQRRGLNEQFTSAAFALKKGVVSEPVETPYGFHLIMVTDRKDGTPVDFEREKLLIRNEYAADISERIIANERKTAKIKIEPKPNDLFPKQPAQQPGAPSSSPGAAPAQPAGKAAAPANPATPK